VADLTRQGSLLVLVAIISLSILSLSYAQAGVLQKGCSPTLPCFYGVVKQTNGSPLSNATVKVYPRSGFPPVTTKTGIDGYYVINGAAAGTFTLAAAKEGYAYYETAEFSLGDGQQHGQDFTLSYRGLLTMTFYVVTDEEFRNEWGSAWQQAANAVLPGIAPYYKLYYSLNFKVSQVIGTWNSPNKIPNCINLRNSAVKSLNWDPGNYHGSDVMLILSDQALVDGPCASIPATGGSHPSMLIMWHNPTKSNIALGIGSSLALMHQIGHVFGLPNYTGSYSSVMRSESGCCVMTYAPTEEQTINNRRTWY
jgi:hypothetical protein